MAGVQRAEDEKLKRRLEEDRLGADIIDECRVQLMLKFRFLDLALWRMSLCVCTPPIRWQRTAAAWRTIRRA